MAQGCGAAGADRSVAAHDGVATLIRYAGAGHGLAIFPASISPTGQWYQTDAPYTMPETSVEAKAAFFGTVPEVRS